MENVNIVLVIVENAMKKKNNEVGCIYCDSNSALNSNEECIYCSYISEIGGIGCKKCEYNIQNQKSMFRM